MPLGLTDAPATFYHLMHNMFLDMLYEYVAMYLDDILVYRESTSEHVEHLLAVFEQLRKHKLYAKHRKCTFA